MGLDFRMGFFKGFHAVQRNVAVVVGKMRQHRALGRAGNFFGRRDAAAVVRHGGAQAGQRAGGAPGQHTAPAKPDNADLAAADFGRVMNRRLNVLQHTGGRQRIDGGFIAKTGAHVGIKVAQFNTGLHPLERGRSDDQVPLLSIQVGH